MPKQRVTDNNMRLTESQLRSVIRKLLAEWTPALKADAEWADLTDGSGPISGLLSGKTVDQAIKDLYGHLSDLEMDELKDQFPELDADIISSGDEAEALDHLRVVVTAIHAENEKDYARDAVRQDLMYFATKSKRPELKALQQRVLDPKEPEYTITSLAYEEDLKAVLGKLEDEVASLSDEEAKRLRNILSAEEDEDRFMRPRPESDPKLDPDAATVPGIKEAGKKSNHDPNYGAPEGSKRDKQLDATKADLKSGDPKRVARAYRRRKRMEDKARSEPGYKNKPRKDTKKESVQMPETALRKVIRSVLEEELNKKTKATLKKKAEKRGLLQDQSRQNLKKGSPHLQRQVREKVCLHTSGHTLELTQLHLPSPGQSLRSLRPKRRRKNEDHGKRAT